MFSALPSQLRVLTPVALGNTWIIVGWDCFRKCSCPWRCLAAVTVQALQWGLAVCSGVIGSVNGSPERMGEKNISTMSFILLGIGLKVRCSLMVNMV